MAGLERVCKLMAGIPGAGLILKSERLSACIRAVSARSMKLSAAITLSVLGTV